MPTLYTVHKLIIVYLNFHFSQRRPEGIAEVNSTSCSQLYPSVDPQLCSICVATPGASGFKKGSGNQQ